MFSIFFFGNQILGHTFTGHKCNEPGVLKICFGQGRAVRPKSHNTLLGVEFYGKLSYQYLLQILPIWAAHNWITLSCDQAYTPDVI